MTVRSNESGQPLEDKKLDTIIEERQEPKGSISSYLAHSCSLSGKIKKVCLIGSGVMGSRIAALIANASIEVILLDVLSTDPKNPNAIPIKAIESLLAQNPSGFTSVGRQGFIKIGNLEQDLQLISQCDLIIEAIIEKIEIKIDLYTKIAPYLKVGAILASNTSTIPLKQLRQHLPTNIKSKFMITHFFNPPRFIELVELIIDKETSSEDAEAISNFIANDLGKTIVRCNDTPGFIANRIGCFLLELVTRKAINEGLSPTIIDNIFIKLFKLPKTGIFGLYDLIGHDVLKLISASLIKSLASRDMYNDIYLPTLLMDNMLKAGIIGRKSGAGFYQYISGSKIREVIEFTAFQGNWQPIYYQEARSSSLEPENRAEFDNIAELLRGNSQYSVFFREVITKFYAYIATLIPSVASSTTDIDLVMRLGYSWKYGPFELLNIIPEAAELIASDTRVMQKMFNSSQDTEELPPFMRESEAIIHNSSCRLCNKEGYLVFSINSKMNCLNSEIFDLLLESVDYAERINKDIYIYSPLSPNFSAGADLNLFYDLIMAKEFSKIDDFLKLGQKTMMRLKYSRVNIISCARGVALGGGCELLLHSDWILAHSELKAGLVEVGVGLIAGWGGIKEIFLRSEGRADILIKSISKIISFSKSSSADDFAGGYAMPNFKIVMNKAQLLKKAFELKIPTKIINPINKVRLPNIELTDYFDIRLLTKLQIDIIVLFQKLINLKVVNEQRLLDFERETFINLCSRPEIIAKLKTIIT
ncbi:MAG: 3-hydroxyacyl-CoA dehydrogenase/enoyl-CoA hydratase family protein [Janthinobacterium lividum]